MPTYIITSEPYLNQIASTPKKPQLINVTPTAENTTTTTQKIDYAIEYEPIITPTTIPPFGILSDEQIETFTTTGFIAAASVAGIVAIGGLTSLIPSNTPTTNNLDGNLNIDGVDVAKEIEGLLEIDPKDKTKKITSSYDTFVIPEGEGDEIIIKLPKDLYLELFKKATYKQRLKKALKTNDKSNAFYDAIRKSSQANTHPIIQFETENGTITGRLQMIPEEEPEEESRKDNKKAQLFLPMKLAIELNGSDPRETLEVDNEPSTNTSTYEKFIGYLGKMSQRFNLDSATTLGQLIGVLASKEPDTKIDEGEIDTESPSLQSQNTKSQEPDPNIFSLDIINEDVTPISQRLAVRNNLKSNTVVRPEQTLREHSESDESDEFNHTNTPKELKRSSTKELNLIPADRLEADLERLRISLTTQTTETKHSKTEQYSRVSPPITKGGRDERNRPRGKITKYRRGSSIKRGPVENTATVIM